VWQELTDMVKEDVYDAVVAADDWQDAAKPSFNTALPAGFRNNATAAQKTLLLQTVIAVNYMLDDPQAATVLGCVVAVLIMRIASA